MASKYTLNKGDYGFKAFKSYPRLSEETLAFTATLTFKGKPIAEVKNEGCGGCNITRFTHREDEAALIAFAKALPPYKGDTGESGLSMDMDFFLSLLADAEDNNAFRTKESKRWIRTCTKATVFRFLGDKAGSWRTVATTSKTPLPADAFVKWAASKYPAAKIEAILNELLPADPFAWERF